MSQFTTPFIGELIGKNKWSNYEPFEYHVGSYPSEEVISIPIGFETDFASIPRFLWPIISPIDDHGKAAVVHDYLYFKGIYTRKRSDLIYKEALEVLNVNQGKIYIMYYLVRVFGWLPWWNHRRKGHGR